MKIIYICYGGAHSSITAAHIHVGNIGPERPGWKEIACLPHFDRVSKQQRGKPFYIGTDEKGNEIYTLGLGPFQKMGLKLIKSLISYYQKPQEEFMFVFTLPIVGLVTRLGGFLSRALNLIRLGRPLAAWGIRRKWGDFLKLVAETKNKSQGGNEVRRKVIVVTDGDLTAQATVEKAAKNVGGRCISLSAGNPSNLAGHEVVDLIKQAKYDPVLVMVDDAGFAGEGKGESALSTISNHPDIELLGILAVASNTEDSSGVHVDFSVTKSGEITEKAVDKEGLPAGSKNLKGDTVDNIDDIDVPVVIGIGDIGKMGDTDAAARITTQAVEEILRRTNNLH